MTNAGQKKLILLVDDVPANIRVAHEILKHLYKTRVATSGAMALEAVKATPPPDLILLDVMMPELDGFGVCEILRRDLATASIPIVMLTAISGELGRLAGLASGATDFVSKPFSTRLLVRRIHNILEKAVNARVKPDTKP